VNELLTIVTTMYYSQRFCRF